MTDASSIAVSFIGFSPSPATAGGTCMITVAVKTVSSALIDVPVSGWSGSPATVDIASELMEASADMLAFVDQSATLEQRIAESDALLTASADTDGVTTLTAHGSVPSASLPVRVVANASFMRSEDVTVQSSSWTGTGPWVSAVTVTPRFATAFCLPSPTADADDAQASLDAFIHVSDVSGTTVTLRAMTAKPSRTVTLRIMGVRRRRSRS